MIDEIHMEIHHDQLQNKYNHIKQKMKTAIKITLTIDEIGSTDASSVDST
jgi:hypothetical protein